MGISLYKYKTRALVAGIVLAVALASCGTLPNKNGGASGGGSGAGGGSGGASDGGSGGTGGSESSGSCGTIVEGYYELNSLDGYSCGDSGYSLVSATGSTITIGGITASFTSGCSFATTDRVCSGVYSTGLITLTCDLCNYDLYPLAGEGCENGVNAGYYDVVSSDYWSGGSCSSFIGGLTQTAETLQLGALEGTIDNKCAVAMAAPNEDLCFGIYANGVFSLECPDCSLDVYSMPLSSAQLGVYQLYSSLYGTCAGKGFGDTIRLFIKDAYFDAYADLAIITEDTLLEAYDSGDNLIFSTPINDDGTMRFEFNGEPVDAKLDSFKLPLTYTPNFYVTFTQSSCNIYYSP